jgi:type IV secretory pathway VirB2 component (pilin)
MKIFRLVVLMCVGALFGSMISARPTFSDEHGYDHWVQVLCYVLAGALCGTVIEVLFRIVVADVYAGSPQKVNWRFSVRQLLLIVAIVAAALWVFVMLRKL